MKTRKEIKISVQGGRQNMIIPKGTRCVPAKNLPEDDKKVYWVKPSWKMDRNTKNGIWSHGILLTEEEILNGIN
jgi:hypothetical protein